MDKNTIIEFFDRHAPTWDENQPDDSAVIRRILSAAGIAPGQKVLDVACGTGVLFPYYLALGAAVTGVDLSPAMVEAARKKYPAASGIELICADVTELDFCSHFDHVMVYNALPHFPRPAELISTLAGFLRPGGQLTIAHGASRRVIDLHHEGPAKHVSMGLMPVGELMGLLAPLFEVRLLISNEEMYQLTAVKKQK